MDVFAPVTVARRIPRAEDDPDPARLLFICKLSLSLVLNVFFFRIGPTSDYFLFANAEVFVSLSNTLAPAFFAALPCLRLIPYLWAIY